MALQFTAKLPGYSAAPGCYTGGMPDTQASIHRLILHPGDAERAPASQEAVCERLRELEFIGEAYEHGNGTGERAFLAGEQFLQLLTFMGCSPHIELAPRQAGDQDFCHIRVSPLYPSPRFRAHARDVFARCPACGRREPDWLARIAAWQAGAGPDWQCARCGEAGSLYRLGWRQKAGFGRLFIDVFSIFPQEGIPAERLLRELESLGAGPWRYFFSNTH